MENPTIEGILRELGEEAEALMRVRQVHYDEPLSKNDLADLITGLTSVLETYEGMG